MTRVSLLPIILFFASLISQSHGQDQVLAQISQENTASDLTFNLGNPWKAIFTMTPGLDATQSVQQPSTFVPITDRFGAYITGWDSNIFPANPKQSFDLTRFEFSCKTGDIFNVGGDQSCTVSFFPYRRMPGGNCERQGQIDETIGNMGTFEVRNIGERQEMRGLCALEMRLAPLGGGIVTQGAVQIVNGVPVPTQPEINQITVVAQVPWVSIKSFFYG